MKLGDFFNSWHFLISECNLADFPMLKNVQGKISVFLHIENLLKLPSKQVFSVFFRFRFRALLPC